MCDCLTKLRAKIESLYPDADLFIPKDMLSGCGITTCEGTEAGKKKPIYVHVKHRYCPFCGEKYQEGGAENGR